MARIEADGLFTRRCAQCGVRQSVTCFSWSGGRYHSHCYTCCNDALLVRIQIWKSALILELGGKCAVCGTTDHRVLTAHHVQLDGKADADITKRRCGGSRRLRYYIRLLYRAATEPFTLRLLCANCHLIEHSGSTNAGPTFPDALRLVGKNLTPKATDGPA
jgi:hypothetical protein